LPELELDIGMSSHELPELELDIGMSSHELPERSWTSECPATSRDFRV
jgi:hypothetical protein